MAFNLDLENSLKKYTEITKKLIQKAEIDDFENFDSIVNQRQEIISDLDKLKYDKESFIKICEELNIVKLDSLLSKMVLDAKVKTKQDMERLNKSISARDNYVRLGYEDGMMFSKKI